MAFIYLSLENTFLIADLSFQESQRDLFSVRMLHCHNHIHAIHIYMQKYSQHNNDERTHFFRKIHLSHFIRNGCERVMCERWVGDWTNCSILTPSSFAFSSTYFSFCWAAQSGVLRAHSPLLGAGSVYSILSPTLTPTHWTSCRTGLYHCLMSTYFLWASHLHPIQPVHSQGYTLISSTECTCSLIDGWVEGYYVTRNHKIWHVHLIFVLR